DAEMQRVAALRDQLRAGILSQVDDVIVHTPDEALPGHLHLSFPGAEGDSLIMLLDSLGIECSTGSACSSGVNRASEVLLAMGMSEHDARGAIRFTLGRTTTSDDVATVLGVIGDVVARARIAGMAG
ncbi:aminotransferase class V-fold PLP-dependent enzyme, partial [Corynebacterium durum]